jgi:Fe-Mn family superoxide dismutase
MTSAHEDAASSPLHALNEASHVAGGRARVPAMTLALEANFGSVDRWRSAFTALSDVPGHASGWLLLTFLPRDGSLVNEWAADSAHAMAGGVPLLAFDLGVRASRLEAFVDDIDWAAVYERYQYAVHDASEPFGAGQEELGDALLLDVRRAGMFEKAEALIPGAQWRDPAAVSAWSGEVAIGRDVVVYCIYGHEVGRATALRLRAQGVPARYLRGGIDAWQSAGRPLEPKEVSS